MKLTAIAMAIAAAVALSGCGMMSKKPSGVTAAEDTRTPVKDAKVSTEWRDQGIKITYSLTGNLEKIEVYGLAPVWKGNHAIIAEMDAKDKLVKFVHGQSVTTERRQRIIARSLERARDNSVNRIDNNLEEFEFDSAELESGSPSRAAPDDNMSRRTAERIDRTMIDSVQTISASGRLTGVRKVGDRISRDGKIYIAIYQWSEKDQATSEFIRNRMR